MTSDDLYATVLASLTTAGFTDATATCQSDSIVIATVPAARTAWADFALASHTALRLADHAGRARYALFPKPNDTEPYNRTVYFRASGPGLAQQHVDQELCHTVRIVPGSTTEVDIPKALATAPDDTGNTVVPHSYGPFATDGDPRA